MDNDNSDEEWEKRNSATVAHACHFGDGKREGWKWLGKIRP